MATAKKTAKKSTTTSSTRSSSAGTKKTAAKRPPAKKSATKKSTSASRTSKRAPLREREPNVVLEDAGYAVTGVVGDVVDLARALPKRAEDLLQQVGSTAKDTPKRLKELRSEAPAKLESQVKELRSRVAKDRDRWVSSFEKTFDSKAAEGRKYAEQVRQDERIATLLDRTATSRGHVKAAVTSATKTADLAVEAGRKQLGVARSQAKGAVTAASKTAEKARAASEDQAEITRNKVKAATTSTRRSADEVAEAATD